MAKTYKEEKPQFGHAMFKYYPLDPNYINLNNGSYGTPPKPVLQAAEELTTKIEMNPDLFIRIEYVPLLKTVRQKVAALIGAKTEEVALVTNASVGLNTVLRIFDWEEGDIIFSFSTTYESVSTTIQYLTDISPHLTSRVLNLHFPTTHSEIVQQFRKYLQDNPAKPNKKRVAVIDSIISMPGVLLPWKEMVKICKEEGVWSVIDAAHSIGQEVGINLTEAAPDFWVSNCYKWLSSKRSCAVLYVPERNQHMIKASFPTSAYYVSPSKSLHPTASFEKHFEWAGATEFAPYLTLPDALEFRDWMGGEEKINAYCRDLALEGGKVLAQVLGTSVMDPNGELTLNMTNVALPLRSSLKPSPDVIMALRRKILLDHNAFSAPFYHNGKWWTRCSAQVWNELDDFEKIGKAWLQVCDDIAREFGSDESSLVSTSDK